MSPLVSTARLSVGFFLVFPVTYYGEFCLYVATNFFCIPLSCQEITCLTNVRQRGGKILKISWTLHILILNCSIFTTQTGLPTCVQ
jgi:hypothetical protein